MPGRTRVQRVQTATWWVVTVAFLLILLQWVLPVWWWPHPVVPDAIAAVLFLAILFLSAVGVALGAGLPLGLAATACVLRELALHIIAVLLAVGLIKTRDEWPWLVWVASFAPLVGILLEFLHWLFRRSLAQTDDNPTPVSTTGPLVAPRPSTPKGAGYWIVPTIAAVLLYLGYSTASAAKDEPNPIAVVVVGYADAEVQRAWSTSIPSCADVDARYQDDPVFDSPTFSFRRLDRVRVIQHWVPATAQIGITENCQGDSVFWGQLLPSEGAQTVTALFQPPGEAQDRSLGNQIVPVPRVIDTVVFKSDSQDPPVSDDAGARVWRSVQQLNVVQQVATPHSTVTIVLYPEHLGAFEPETTHWLVVVTAH